MEPSYVAPDLLRRLGVALEDLLEKRAAPPSFFAQRESCIQTMTEALGRLGPEWKVEAFGSSSNGFAAAGSDLDVTCYRSSSSPATAGDELRQLLQQLLDDEPGRFALVEEVLSARVPILKLRFESVLDVDLSCGNVHALRNTRLLRAYADLSPRLRELVLAVKAWAKEEGVCGSSSRHLSSYAFTLMVIYFMQVDPYVQMPCIPTSQFQQVDAEASCEVFESSSSSSWGTELPLPMLLCRFFHFYASDFVWGREVVAMRSGKRLFLTELEFHELKGRHLSRLHVQDPFLLGRNLNCTLGPDQEFVLRGKFLDAVNFLLAGVVPAFLTNGQRSSNKITLPPGSWPRLTPPSSQCEADNEGCTDSTISLMSEENDGALSASESCANSAHGYESDHEASGYELYGYNIWLDSQTSAVEQIDSGELSAATLWLGPEPLSTEDMGPIQYQ